MGVSSSLILRILLLFELTSIKSIRRTWSILWFTVKRLPATDGHCGSPSSRFLTLNWSSWSVRLETMGESSLGDPGPGDEATRDWSGQAGKGRQREKEMERESVYKCVCMSHYLRLLSILWKNQMGSIHTTLSSGGSLQPPLVIFCHQSSAIFSLLSSSLLFPSSLPPSSLPPFGATSVHSWLL